MATRTAIEALREIEAKLTAPGAPFEVVEETVLGERMRVLKNRKRSLRELLAESAAHGDREWMVYGERRITYAQHVALVASAAAALRERFDIQPGDRVAILAENRPEWVIAFWATLSLGGIVAALNGWWTADEIRFGIEHSEPKLLIGDRKRLARLAGGDPGVPVLEIESEFEALLGFEPGAALPDVPIDEDDPAVILFTSGTTGRPKGAVNTHRGMLGFVQLNFLNGARSLMRAAERGLSTERPQIRSLVTMPLFHLSGMHAGNVMMLASGATTVWRSGRFDPADVLRLIESERITHWSGLGNTAHRVMAHPDFARRDLSSIVQVGSGGAPTSPEHQERLGKAFPGTGANMGLGYGSSESVAVVASIAGEELEQHRTSAGRPPPTVELEIRGPNGDPLPDGQEGEIHVRSPYTMREYWRDPDATAKAILPGRWLATGDVGRIEDGRLYINSRARDMILRGGENIYPVEIEQRLEAHEVVAEAAVVGVEHAELGQEVKAIIVTAGSPPPENLPALLADWVAEKLARYKVPAHWELRAEPLPRNAAGKVLKNVLTGSGENHFVED